MSTEHRAGRRSSLSNVAGAHARPGSRKLQLANAETSDRGRRSTATEVNLCWNRENRVGELKIDLLGRMDQARSGRHTRMIKEEKRYRFDQRLGQHQVYIRFDSIEAISDSCGDTGRRSWPSNN